MTLLHCVAGFLTQCMYPLSFIGCICLCWILCMCIYRVTYHPLASYPGPFLAKLTELYIVYHALRGDFHLDVHRCHLKYGPIIRYGPNKLLFNTVEGMQDIYGHGKRVKKSQGYAILHTAPGVSSSVTCIDKVQHGRKRRVVNQGLSDAAIRAFESTLVATIDIFCQQVVPDDEMPGLDGWSIPKDMAILCEWLTYDVDGHFTFGTSFSMLTSPVNRYIPPLITAATRRNFVYAQMPSLAALHLDRLLYPSARRMGRKFLDLTRTMAEERQRRELDHDVGTAKSDLLSFIINAVDPKTDSKFSSAELWAECKTLLVAGSDTSAIGLAATLFYLTRVNNESRQTPLERLTAEVLTVFPNGLGSISLDNPAFQSCAYLRACIDEAMRSSPPASIAMWREVEESLDPVLISRQSIPPGTEVGTCIYALHHNESYFPDSFSFDPERWLASHINPPDTIRRQRDALLTFQYGPWSCAGKNFALSEMRLVLARLVYVFEFRAARGRLGEVGQGGPGKGWGRDREGESQILSHITGLIDGPWVEFRRRRKESI